VSSHAPEDGAHDDRQSGQRPRIRGLRSTSAKYHQDPAGKRSWSCASAETTSQPTDWSCVFAQTTVSSIRAIPGALPGPRFFFVAVLRQSCCTTPSAQSGLPFPQSRPPLVVAAGARAQRYTCARSLTPAALLARYSRQANVSRKDNTHFSYLSFRTKVSRE
jgi:hypothetical protein